MLHFIRTTLFIVAICFTVKTLAVTGAEYAKENKEELGALVEAVEPEKLKAAKEFIASASSTVEVDGKVYEVSDAESVGELYKLAESEADKMIATGDATVYKEQMEKNKPFLSWLKGLGKNEE